MTTKKRDVVAGLRHAKQARALLDKLDPNGAETAAKVALTHDPDCALACFVMGRISLDWKVQSVTETRTWLRRAASLPEAQAMLAHVEAVVALGEAAEAGQIDRHLRGRS